MQAFKFKSLKMISATVAAAISTLSYQPAQAAPLGAVGRVNNVFVPDFGTFGANANGMALVGVTSLGNCATFFGLVIFRMKDDPRGQQQLSLALAAAASGSTVSVNVDDTVRDAGGNCYVINISFSGN